MREVLLGHQIVRFDGCIDVLSMDANSGSHQHVLWTLDDFSVYFQQIRSLECLEAKVVVVEVAIVDNGRIQLICVLHDDFVDLVANHWRFASVRLHVVQIGDHICATEQY